MLLSNLSKILTDEFKRHCCLSTKKFRTQAPVPVGRIFSQLFTLDINSAIASNLKPIGMMEMQCVTIIPNIYECVSDYMKINHDRF